LAKLFFLGGRIPKKLEITFHFFPGRCRTLPGVVGRCQALSGVVGRCRALSGVVGRCRALQGDAGRWRRCRALPWAGMLMPFQGALPDVVRALPGIAP